MWYQIACLPLVLVALLVATNKLRRPYVHLGCWPGGGHNGRKNSLGGSSPFHITLRKGENIEAARDLADWVRGAAAKSRQGDAAKAREREMARNVNRKMRAEKMESVVAVHSKVGAAAHSSSAAGGARVDEETSTSDVVAEHLAGEAEMALVVGVSESMGTLGAVFSLEWWIGLIENMAVVAVILVFVAPEVESVTCKHMVWCDWVPELPLQ